jgi:hypothetical protein
MLSHAWLLLIAHTNGKKFQHACFVGTARKLARIIMFSVMCHPLRLQRACCGGRSAGFGKRCAAIAMGNNASSGRGQMIDVTDRLQFA